MDKTKTKSKAKAKVKSKAKAKVKSKAKVKTTKAKSKVTKAKAKVTKAKTKIIKPKDKGFPFKGTLVSQRKWIIETLGPNQTYNIKGVPMNGSDMDSLILKGEMTVKYFRNFMPKLPKDVDHDIVVSYSMEKTLRGLFIAGSSKELDLIISNDKGGFGFISYSLAGFHMCDVLSDPDIHVPLFDHRE